MGIFGTKRSASQQQMRDDLLAAAQEAGAPGVESATQDTQRTPILWKILLPWLWFRNLKAGLGFTVCAIGLVGIWYFVDWKPLLAAPVFALFGWWWWKHHFHVEEVMVIEVRAEGQIFRTPHVRHDMRVSDSCFRVFFAPRVLYDKAIRYGVFQPIYEVPPNIVICDYFDEVRNVFIFNEDPDWTNAAIVFQLNSETAKNLKKRGRRLDWLKQKQREAIAEFKAGKLDKTTLEAVLQDTEHDLALIRESPLTKRSFAHYYQDKIPRLKRQVIELLKGIEEYSFALAAEMAYQLYGQPFTPEAEKSIAVTKTKYGRVRLNIFEDFELMPEFKEMIEQDGEEQVHALAEEARLASGRATALAPGQVRRRVT